MPASAQRRRVSSLASEVAATMWKGGIAPRR